MGILTAGSQGAVNKGVNSISVSDAQGAVDKSVDNGYVSHVQGGITKQFYANWQYYAGTILNSSSGGGDLISTASLTPDALAYDIKPAHIYTYAFVQAVDVNTISYIKLEVKYLNSSGSWVVLKSTTKTVSDSGGYISLNFDVAEDIVTKQIQYRLTRYSGEPAEYGSFLGKCTEWYKKG